MNKESKSKFNLLLSELLESFRPGDEAQMFDLVNTLHDIVKGVGSSIARETDTVIYIHVGPVCNSFCYNRIAKC